MWRRANALVTIMALTLAACGGSHKANQSTTTPTIESPGAAWEAVLDQINPDGTVSTETALEAFSLAFGPLPGVTRPSGTAKPIADGTGPLRWLVAHWKDITTAQRAAAQHLVPELGQLSPRAQSTADTSAQPATYLADARLPRLAGPSPQSRSNFFYTQESETLAQQIGLKVGISLGIPIDAHVGPPAPGEYADTGVYNSSGDYEGTPAKCVITISPLGDALGGDDLDGVLAHEVWHCFQGAILGLDKFWFHPPAPWIMEGEAEWVGITMFPNAPLDVDFWGKYLKKPDTLLFKRSYDAKGFYAQLVSSGTDVWTKLVPILQASGNAAAFQTSGANSDAFLNLWASGFVRDPARGSAWDITGPGVTQAQAIPDGFHLSNGQSVSASAQPYADSVYVVDADSVDVLLFSFPGHARVSGGATDYLVQGSTSLCHRSGGCDCPGQPPPQVPLSQLEGSNIVLAVTGDPGGDMGSVTGLSLDQFCKVNLTGTWTGTWTGAKVISGPLTLTLVQTGNEVSGTLTFQSRPCSGGKLSPPYTIPLTGSVSGSAVTLTISLTHATLAGTVSGASMSGTWTPSFCPGQGTWQVSKTG